MSSLDDSLVDFEEERLSILDQLRALEEKLLTMSSGKGSHDKGRVTEQYTTCDGKESNEGQDNGFVTDYFKKESNMNLLPGNESMYNTAATRLLPLLDAAENEADREEIPREHPEPGFCKLEPSGSGSISEDDGQKVAIEEEVDRVYERLQALEADREFLKHCMSSIKQGDKGMSLLQEILQHLRDLKSVELRARCLDE
ncbi:hypothetical protein MLD38_000050 [Melastoma candidum]|nr:hypothetical protein MLD38_000050 [Melastoma candidum]